MKKIALSLLLLALIPTGTRASFWDEEPEDMPNACYVIFLSRAAAQRNCPPGVIAVAAFDFWNHRFIGWQCKCSED